MSTQVFEPAAPVLEPPPAPAVGRRPRRLAVAALALALTSGTAGGLAVAASAADRASWTSVRLLMAAGSPVMAGAWP